MTSVESGNQFGADAFRTVFRPEQLIQVFTAKAGQYVTPTEITDGVLKLGYEAMDPEMIPGLLHRVNAKLQTTRVYSIFKRGVYWHGPRVEPGEWVALPQTHTFQDPRISTIDHFCQQGRLRKGNESALVKYFTPEEERLYHALLRRLCAPNGKANGPVRVNNSSLMVELYGENGFHLPTSDTEEHSPTYRRYVQKPYGGLFRFQICSLNTKLEELSIKGRESPSAGYDGLVPRISFREGNRDPLWGNRIIVLSEE